MARFDELVTMLSEGVSERRRIGLLLHRDGVNHRLKGRRGANAAHLRRWMPPG